MAMTNEKAWDYAIGIVQVDGIKPSDEFLELVEKEKRGELTGDDIRRILCQKYTVNNTKAKNDRKKGNAGKDITFLFV